jgi:hypothetical protein
MAWTRTRKQGGACGDFDYGTDGGPRTAWCHATQMSIPLLLQHAGMPMFLSGPHTQTDFNFAAPTGFGHYNPAFVAWLTTLVPARQSLARRSTQLHYDKYAPLAQVFYATLGKIESDKRCFEKERDAYAAAIRAGKSGSDFSERWYFYMNPKFCGFSGTSDAREKALSISAQADGGVNGNVTKTVIGFWARRSMDGTFDAFATLVHAVKDQYGTRSRD